MRVLFNGMQAGNRSGTGRYVEELLRAMDSLDIPGGVCAVLPKQVAIPLKHVQTQRVATEGPLSRLWAEHWQIPRNVRGYEVVHYPAGLGPLRACERLVLTVHDLAVFRHPEWFTPARAYYYRAAMRRGVRQARRIIADSAATAADLQEFLGAQQDAIDIVPLGVSKSFAPASPEEITRVRVDWRLPEQFLLHLGTLEPRKNLARLVEAWSAVAGQIPSDLVLAGRLGWKYEGILQAVERSPFRNRIHLIDHVPNAQLPALLSAARGFVYPSLYEGFGLPPLEAMACGTPVAVSSVSSLPEVAGDAALLVRPDDTEALAGVLLRLALEDRLCEELREKGLRRAASYTWRNTAKLTVRAYEKSLE